jgi:hypothetical protein
VFFFELKIPHQLKTTEKNSIGIIYCLINFLKLQQNRFVRTLFQNLATTFCVTREPLIFDVGIFEYLVASPLPLTFMLTVKFHKIFPPHVFLFLLDLPESLCGFY